nr:putative ribonuclease H-like domain-containing protein [Tanacetum cinerariifolium]
MAQALADPDWVEAMQAEIQQFKNQKVWVLVPIPDGKRAIRTKWILKNKKDARGIVCRNKARLVAQGHRHEEGIDYTDVFAHVAKIEAIRLFLAFASFIGFKVYQMDVKSAFLYGKIAEEVYVTQPRGFEDLDHPKKVYKVVKALYGLHQAPRAWYERLSTFLLKHGYRRGSIDQTLFIKMDSNDIMLVQVYVDDIIFGSTRKDWWLQVDQRPDGIFIHQEKYVADILKKFNLDNSKLASTPFEPQKIREKNVPDEPISVHLYRSMIGCLMYLTVTRPDIMFTVCATARHQVTPKTSNLLSVKRIFKYLTAYPKLGLRYPRDSPFDQEAFSNSDYAGAHGDRKSTTGGCYFLGRRDANEKKLIQLWLLVTSAGRVIFYWLIVISAGDLVPGDGVKGLEATIDGTSYTVTEASIRSALQLDDLNAIDTLTNAEIFDGLRAIGYAPDMPLLAHMLNQGEPALVQAQPQEVSPPPPSPMVEPHPSTDPMPSLPRQSSPSRILFGPAPSSGVASTIPIQEIPSSSRPTKLVLETITSPIRDDDTGGGSFHKSPPSPPPATPTRSPTVGVAEEPLTLNSLLALFPTCLQRIATLEAKLKATKILHRDVVVLFAKRIKKLESKLKSKKRKLVLSDSENEEEARQSQELDALLHLANAALHDPSASTTPSKPDNQEQSSEQDISPTTLDAVLTLSQSKTRARATKIIYKRLKKHQSSSSLDFTDAVIPAAGRVSAGGADPADVISAGGADPADVVVSAGDVDSAGTFISAGVLVAAGPSVASAPSSPIRDPAKGKAIATSSSPAQRVAEEQEREIRASAEQSTPRQAKLDRIALNLTNEEWIGLVDQRRKAIAEMKAKAKRDKPLTPAQQKEYMRAFVKNQSTTIYTTGWTWKDNVYNKIRRAVDLATAKDHHQQLKRSGETLEYSESKKLRSSHSTEQSVELLKTTSVPAGATLAAGDPISVVPSVPAVSVFTTAGVSESASVPIIDLLDSPPKATSLPLDPVTAEQAVPLRKSSRKKSMARRRTLYRPDAVILYYAAKYNILS